jgi:hypothetical protein
MNYGRFARTLALACLFLAAVHSASAAAAPMDSAMRTAASALERASALRKVPTDSLASGLSPQVGTWLRAGLAGARKEKSASARAADLRALAASLRLGAALADRPSGTAPANLRAGVRHVLAESAFRTSSDAAPKKVEQSWLGRLLEAIAEWWARIMFRVIGAAAGAPILGNIFAFVLIAVAALALAFLVFRIAMLVSARRARESASNADGTPITIHASADETYTEACAAARRGSYGSAIALLFQAALLALDRSGRVPYDSARTAGEYRRAVRRSVSAASASFETLARAFTFVAYAQAQAGEHDWRAADAAYTSMTLAASERP